MLNQRLHTMKTTRDLLKEKKSMSRSFNVPTVQRKNRPCRGLYTSVQKYKKTNKKNGKIKTYSAPKVKRPCYFRNSIQPFDLIPYPFPSCHHSCHRPFHMAGLFRISTLRHYIETRSLCHVIDTFHKS